ncbi:RDD family protein [Haloechinothrix sp. LS1_15]|uniref:RDD family protein n=1 Tax=Haloechinothrix sp. LS1_15 TaxID=2652248 RepID=UPI0029455255|nr:RDD family protein [Haloechinothrix sp. LS1_15]MDV6014588.1 RDD family protein [Haloechinothrix sp. LS1_15]
MARWTGTWLSGLGAGYGSGDEPRWPGERLGLPADGVGAAAGGGKRAVGLLLDWLAAGLIASLFVPPPVYEMTVTEGASGGGYQYQIAAVIAWFAITVPAAAMFGYTPGMAVAGIRVGRLDGAGTIGLWRAVVRWAMTFLLIPVVIRNVDGRGLHDRATGTVVITMR